MSRIVLNELHREIIQNLTRKEFMRKLNLSEEKIQSLLLNRNFVTKLSLLISKDTITCKDVLDLSIEVMELLTKHKPSNWLEYIFQYVLNKSFPNSVTIEMNPLYENSVIVYLEILKTVFKHDQNTNAFNKYNSFEFLTRDEIKKLPNPKEYIKFLRIFNDRYIYELMRLSQEITSHNTLEHICGVHYVSMHIGRQLWKTGIPIDLGLVSGAAAGHDIGKYGCKGSEVKRVPYLHYYYTDVWFKKFDIPNIGHIAVNHSTWDLELENLPLESLILIYADFRVKNRKFKNSRKMYIYSLEDSFEIILSKLDNVDEAKEKRYKRVYDKLKDFEDYMIGIGINIDLISLQLKNVQNKDYAILNSSEVIRNIKYMAIEHNISLMSKLSSDFSYGRILEDARSEKNWKNIRAYLNVFEEYSTYLTQKQKILTLNFLYELFVHREGDIRRQAGELLGKIIVDFDEEYRKEIPEDVIMQKNETDSLSLWKKYLDLIIYPDHKTTDQHKEWICYTFRIVVDTVLDHCDESRKLDYINIYLSYFNEYSIDDRVCFILLDSLWHVPFELCSDKQIDTLISYSIKAAKSSDLKIKIAAINFMYNLTRQQFITDKFLEPIKELLCTINYLDNISTNYLKYKAIRNLNVSEDIVSEYNKIFMRNKDLIPDIFLTNLKAATPWIEKTVNIDFVIEHIKNGSETISLHTATHFCNLVKVSAKEIVRNKAGRALLEIAPMLSIDQRNDIAVELMRGLDIEGYEFSKYIPEYLGQFTMFLHPKELDELLNDFKHTLKDSSPRLSSLILNTLGVMLQYYPKYKTRFEESDEKSEKRLVKILCIILSGLANYNNQVKQEAFLVIGKNLFGSNILNLKEKYEIFKILYKKLLTLLSEKEINDLFFFNNSASLNHIYRFISDYNFYYEEINFKEPNKIALFPGTFDPFSLSHKGIVREIRDLGFEVFLAVDEFSWSKRTQPRMLRRQIINMSIADEFGMYMFPDNIPINLANNNDLKILKDIFANKDVYIVVGSDVLVNASSYKARPLKNSIHSFNHVIFQRASAESTERDLYKTNNAMKKIKGDIIELKLPVHLEDISSSLIREHIDENRDISNLIDPLAQQFIYEYGLYLREPQYKTLIKTKSLKIEIVNDLSKNIIDELGHYIFMYTNLYENVGEELTSKNINLLVIREGSSSNKLLGFSAFHQISTSDLYSEFMSTEIANYVRNNTSGKIIVIDGIYTNPSAHLNNIEQILITETLSHCLKNDFTYALYHNILTNINKDKIFEILELQGFTKLPNQTGNPVYAVDMKKPISLMLNLESFIKEPLNTRNNVLSAIYSARKKLQIALTKLYPGNLVISFDNEVLHHNLVDKICKTNNVPRTAQTPRTLGEYMCVPFGNILKGMVVPNTVTKSLHTEKIFESDVRNFKIGEYPFYSSLENQIRTIKSFNKPVILVDDLLNKGYRIKALDPILKSEQIKVEKIIVGILSGRGKDLMEIQEREVDAAYYIPNLRLWFNENLLYPFIGGDAVWREEEPNVNLIQSVNLILPYFAPHFIKDTSKKDIYNLSMVCLKNAQNILKALEAEYQNIYEKNLTLKRLGEVLISPHYPDLGKFINYDFNRNPSSYITNDIEKLIRLERIVK